MNKNRTNSRIVLSFFLSASTVLTVLSNDALAGSRRCQSYPDDTFACVDQSSGFRIDCRSYEGHTRTICTGKNNYRKECFIGSKGSSCEDSNGVKMICKRLNPTVCENSLGFRSVCRNYDGGVTICTDVSRWGKPIKD